MPTPLTLDRRHRRPLHRQIYDQLREAILSGRLAPGDRAPSTRELAVALRVARTTVTVAYDQLIAEGYLDARTGAGTFVCRELPERPRHRSPRTLRDSEKAPSIRCSRFATRLAPLMPPPAVPPGTIDLSPPAPDGALFPFAVW